MENIALTETGLAVLRRELARYEPFVKTHRTRLHSDAGGCIIITGK